MFPFRPSRAAQALLELADAMLAPQPADPAVDDVTGSTCSAPSACAAPHPHRRPVAIDRRRRPGSPSRPQPCLAPLTRAAHERAASRPAGTAGPASTADPTQRGR